MKKVNVKYKSEKRSIFFKKGGVYEAVIIENKGGRFLAKWFPAEEMDEEGYYALDMNDFELLNY